MGDGSCQLPCGLALHGAALPPGRRPAASAPSGPLWARPSVFDRGSAGVLPDGVGVGGRGAVEGRVSQGGGFGREGGALDAVPAEPAGRVPLAAPGDEVPAVAGAGDQVGLDPSAGHRAVAGPGSHGPPPTPGPRPPRYGGRGSACPGPAPGPPPTRPPPRPRAGPPG